MSLPTDERTTPQDFFDKLNGCFSFTLDAAATAENAKCPAYWTLADDALKQDWGGHRIFCNPPYSRGQLMLWVTKSAQAMGRGGSVVMLIPGDTSTAAFHMAEAIGDLYFMRGRLKFNGMEASAKFGTVLLLVNVWLDQRARLTECVPGFLHCDE
jgi:phage N-6-adenine-methyltransferase